MKKYILIVGCLFLSGCGFFIKNEKPAQLAPGNSNNCDIMYRDICKLYEERVKNILELQRANKITSEQSKNMLTEEHNKAINSTTERFYLINNMESSEEYQDRTPMVEMFQSMRQNLNHNGRPRGLWRSLMDGILRGLEDGAKIRQADNGYF